MLRRTRAAGLAALLAALTVTALGGLASPALAKHKVARQAAGATAGQLRGVNLTPNWAFAVNPYALSDGDNAREIDSACRLGSTAIRMFVSMPDLEPAPGVVNPDYAAQLDSLMGQAAGCGLKVIFSFGGTPLWDTTAPVGEKQFGKYPARDGATQYRWMTAWVMKRWPGLYAIEVANEPNLTSFWMGTPGQYADLVNAAVASKHETGAATLVLAGALAGDGAAGYLQQLYSAGMRGQDAVSIHPYSTTCRPLCNPFTDPGLQGSPFRSSIESVHQTMLQNRDSSRLWLTEFGFSTCPSQPVCVSDSVQADWMAKSIMIAGCYSYVGGLTGFTLRDISVPSTWDATAWHFHFGLMGADFTPKPSFSAVASAFGQLAHLDATARTASVRRRPKSKKKARRVAASYATSTTCRKLLGSSATTTTKQTSKRAGKKSRKLR
jgi:polysaccharide biosynthesis protein PslG